LRCPWHSWEYDITTGQSVFDPRVRVVTYPVEIANFEVAITVN
jgi:nitrite reductase/ring-hydroxylating ferredoxin subunit